MSLLLCFSRKSWNGPSEQGQLHAADFLALPWIMKSAAQHAGVFRSAGTACAIIMDPAGQY